MVPLYHDGEGVYVMFHFYPTVFLVYLYLIMFYEEERIKYRQSKKLLVMFFEFLNFQFYLVT